MRSRSASTFPAAISPRRPGHVSERALRQRVRRGPTAPDRHAERRPRCALPPEPDQKAIPASVYNVASQLLAVEKGADAHPAFARTHLADGFWLALRAARLSSEKVSRRRGSNDRGQRCWCRRRAALADPIYNGVRPAPGSAEELVNGHDVWRSGLNPDLVQDGHEHRPIILEGLLRLVLERYCTARHTSAGVRRLARTAFGATAAKRLMIAASSRPARVLESPASRRSSSCLPAARKSWVNWRNDACASALAAASPSQPPRPARGNQARDTRDRVVHGAC